MPVDGTHEADVLVVGAGLAGLAAARSLARSGASPLVLEARERVGGRVLDRALADGVTVEMGAGFVGPGQDRMLALTRAVGVETFPTYVEGSNVVEVRGRVRRYSGTIPRLGPLALLDAGQTQLKLERMSRRMDAEAPWTSPGAAALDSQSYASWIGRNVYSRDARSLLAVASKTLWGAEPRDLSLLYVLAYVRAAGGLGPLLDTEGGAQELRFAGGPQSVARAAADELGERVVLGAPITRIEVRDGGVEATAGELRARAQRTIVAVPPPLAARIEFDPPLPGFRDQLCQRMPMGSLMKCFALYDEPFWRADGLTGEALSDRGPATICFDTSPRDASAGVLLGFVGGAEARTLGGAAAEERRRLVLDGFVRVFGPRAARPDAYAEQDWPAETWSRGGPVAYMPPGTLTAFGPALREPVGPIHWAGTETATAWTGYMDGAVRSGERAAAEALAALG
ncbi:MAG TPA: FAD-dependent oxidoreductase [Thermoleophilaceae bacterium]